jgi:EAL domain-containing protein (putative c-di-GMP-specific phosphodiesterase class I)
MRAAIESENFVLYMQPILELATGRFSHSDLLLRTVDGKGNLLAPDVFLPVAERFGLMPAIDRWVIRRTINVIRSQSALPVLRVAVNISVASLAGFDLLGAVKQEIDQTSIDPAALILELSESIAMVKLSAARSLASGLKELGCSLALDEFGTGFGSLYHLRELEVAYVKIRGELVRCAPRSAVDDRILAAIVDVAHTMGIKTVAAWVADEETMRVVRERGVDFAQGFHIGQPSSIAAGAADR